MGKINIDKFICSLIKYGDNLDNTWFKMALKDQGLFYEDGKLHKMVPERELPDDSVLKQLIKELEDEKEYNIRPKFKPEQWITDGNVNFLVTEVKNGKYFITAGDIGAYKEMGEINRTFHQWTVNDAKPGDILSSGGYLFIFKSLSEGKLHCERYCCAYEEYVGCDESEWVFATDGNVYGVNTLKPATKKEEELLFRVMKTNGYKWNKDTLRLECEIINKEILFTDLDGTLIDTINGDDFPKGIWDMKFNFDCLDAIKKMNPKCVFIVTNQGGISEGYVSEESFVEKLNYVIGVIKDYCDCPCDAMYCESNDKENPYRKPNTKMLEQLIDNYLSDYDTEIDEDIKSRCLMIGDASGMAWQFSDSDKKTAINFGIDYMDVDDFIHKMKQKK